MRVRYPSPLEIEAQIADLERRTVEINAAADQLEHLSAAATGDQTNARIEFHRGSDHLVIKLAAGEAHFSSVTLRVIANVMLNAADDIEREQRG